MLNRLTTRSDLDRRLQSGRRGRTGPGQTQRSRAEQLRRRQRHSGTRRRSCSGGSGLLHPHISLVVVAQAEFEGNSCNHFIMLLFQALNPHAL